MASARSPALQRRRGARAQRAQDLLMAARAVEQGQQRAQDTGSPSRATSPAGMPAADQDQAVAGRRTTSTVDLSAAAAGPGRAGNGRPIEGRPEHVPLVTGSWQHRQHRLLDLRDLQHRASSFLCLGVMDGGRGRSACCVSPRRRGCRAVPRHAGPGRPAVPGRRRSSAARTRAWGWWCWTWSLPRRLQRPGASASGSKTCRCARAPPSSPGSRASQTMKRPSMRSGRTSGRRSS